MWIDQCSFCIGHFANPMDPCAVVLQVATRGQACYTVRSVTLPSHPYFSYPSCSQTPSDTNQFICSVCSGDRLATDANQLLLPPPTFLINRSSASRPAPSSSAQSRPAIAPDGVDKRRIKNTHLSPPGEQFPSVYFEEAWLWR